MQKLPSRPLPPDIGYSKIYARSSHNVQSIDQWKVTDEVPSRFASVRKPFRTIGAPTVHTV